MTEQQATTDVLMIRPANFCANTQTADSNRFQRAEDSSSDANAVASAEFDGLEQALTNARVRVVHIDDTPVPQTPDAIFPNNWVSFHSDGTVVLYPMLAVNRRQERRLDIIDSLATTRGFKINRVVDLSHLENSGKYLEGTGSLVLDRANHIAYACLSPRTHPHALSEFALKLDYQVVTFEAHDTSGTPIYHSNVALSIGTRFASVCTEAIRADQRSTVLDALQATHPHLLQLSQGQMHEFAGNMLELATTEGKRVVALSSRAAASLTLQQRAELQEWSGPLVSAPIPTIERLGGGSVRCMIAEVHLPRAAHA